MTKTRITDLLGKKIIIGDGAMGTMMQNAGLDMGTIPEGLNITRPEAIKEIHSAYFRAGSDFVTANTFGVNRYKLQNSGYTVSALIEAGIKAARDAVQEEKDRARCAGEAERQLFVALDIAPVGKLMKPVGDMDFDEAYDIFAEQVLAGVAAGADFILFETFTDVCELRAGILAAKENSDLPILASATFQEDGRMLMGSDVLTVVNILQDLGIDALGLNCSLGPAQMMGLVNDFLTYSKLPVLVQPNAGLPVSDGSCAVYDVSAEDYSQAMMEMVKAGVAILGGCCGTTPAYIECLVQSIDDTVAKQSASGQQEQPFPALADNATEQRAAKAMTAVSSTTKTVILDGRVRVIGERINPTGKKLLKEALKNQDFVYLQDEALHQVRCGAEILDINVGLPGIDEQEVMLKAIEKVSAVVSAPLQIDSADPEVLAAAVRRYGGKTIINSVNGKEEVMEAVLPLVKKYGACVIALTLDEKGLPQSMKERLIIAERIIRRAASYGIGRERILVDCLTLTVSAQQEAAKDTLGAIRKVKEQFGVKTTLGASNVSFGLPERKLLNQTFLAMAMEAGLDAPITDPTVSEYMDAIRAFETLSGKDTESRDFIAFYGGKKTVPAEGKKDQLVDNQHNAYPSGAADQGKLAAESRASGRMTESRKMSLAEIIQEGYEEKAAAAAAELLHELNPLEIVEGKIMPALEQVGKDYERGDIFLPQLIKSAETVKNAFVVLKEAMQKAGEQMVYGKIILATVQGDVHDIGKNIVKVILENYGYEVVDLGKDVPIEQVVEAAKAEDIRMVGLSALMTTTVVNMEKTINALKEAGLTCVTAVGGAVLTEDYAKKIGADHYCKDAMDTVRVANGLFRS